MAVDPSGHLAMILTGGTIARVDLATGRRSQARARGSCAGLVGASAGRALTWAGDRIAVIGAELRVFRGRQIVGGAGACLVDPATGATRRLTRDGTSLLVTRDRIVVSGMGHPRDRYLHGAGLTAFTLGGRQLWHAEGERVGRAFAVADRVFLPHQVKRHTQVEAYDLKTGRHLASLFEPGFGVQPISGATLSVGF
jgi:hypothetical protein